MRNSVWSLDEALILFDAMIAVQQGKLSRNHAVIDVSSKLRNRARLQNFVFDETFRSVDEIESAMTSMEALYAGGKPTTEDASEQLFQAVCALYAKNRSFYDVLQQKIAETHEPPLRLLFFSWLSSILSPTNVKLARQEIGRVKKHWRRHSNASERWYDVVDPENVRHTLQRLEALNNGYKFMLLVVGLYYCFLRTCAAFGKSAETTDWLQYFLCLDFVQTIPTTCYYKGELLSKVRSWNELYVEIAKCLYHNNSKSIRKLVLQSFVGSDGRSNYVVSFSSMQLRSPIKLGEGTNSIFLECGQDEPTATFLLFKLRELSLLGKDALQVNFKEIQSQYESPKIDLNPRSFLDALTNLTVESETQVQREREQERRREEAQKSKAKDEKIQELKNKFYIWLQNSQKLADCQRHIRALSLLALHMQNCGNNGKNIWLRKTPSEFQSVQDLVRLNPNIARSFGFDVNFLYDTVVLYCQFAGKSDILLNNQEQQRLEQLRLEQQRLEQQNLDQQGLNQQKCLEQQRLELQRLEQQRLEQQRLNQQRSEQRRLENKRLLKQKKDAEKIRLLREQYASWLDRNIDFDSASKNYFKLTEQIAIYLNESNRFQQRFWLIKTNKEFQRVLKIVKQISNPETTFGYDTKGLIRIVNLYKDFRSGVTTLSPPPKSQGGFSGRSFAPEKSSLGWIPDEGSNMQDWDFN